MVSSSGAGGGGRLVSHKAPSCEFTLNADPSAPGAARDLIGRWLAAARWPGEELDAIVYAVNEAVTNAAEHAYPPGSAGQITVTARIEHNPLGDDPLGEGARREGAGPARRVRVRVRDEGRWQVPPASDEGRRRGLFLMTALMDDVTIQTGPAPAGTEVVLTSATVAADGAGPDTS
jgi:anti-sigma regulatory factor (Ser/Thr protein kinase)